MFGQGCRPSSTENRPRYPSWYIPTAISLIVGRVPLSKITGRHTVPRSNPIGAQHAFCVYTTDLQVQRFRYPLQQLFYADAKFKNPLPFEALGRLWQHAMAKQCWKQCSCNDSRPGLQPKRFNAHQFPFTFLHHLTSSYHVWREEYSIWTLSHVQKPSRIKLLLPQDALPCRWVMSAVAGAPLQTLRTLLRGRQSQETDDQSCLCRKTLS